MDPEEILGRKKSLQGNCEQMDREEDVHQEENDFKASIREDSNEELW